MKGTRPGAAPGLVPIASVSLRDQEGAPAVPQDHDRTCDLLGEHERRAHRFLPRTRASFLTLPFGSLVASRSCAHLSRISRATASLSRSLSLPVAASSAFATGRGTAR